jgi:hypothetical protein
MRRQLFAFWNCAFVPWRIQMEIRVTRNISQRPDEGSAEKIRPRLPIKVIQRSSILSLEELAQSVAQSPDPTLPISENKIAPCEISLSEAASSPPETAASISASAIGPAPVALLNVAMVGQLTTTPMAKDQDFPATTALDAAIEKCVAARKLGGPLSSTVWTGKSFAVLAASVDLVRVFTDDPGALDKTRRALKEDDGRRRALNKDNVSLVAVHLCHIKCDPKETKELSRFASVVALAVHEQIRSEDAESWLRQRTLTDAVAAARALKRGSKPAAKRFENPITKDKYPALFKVLSTAGHKDRETISARIGVFMDELERELHCAADLVPAGVAADPAAKQLSGGGNA